jgi:hypothetical protein
MCAKDRDKADARLNQPSLLERYFSRPMGSRYDRLTYTQYFTLFQSTKREQRDRDQCFRSTHIVLRSKPTSYILKNVSFKDRERFCLSMLLGEILARSWEQLRTD